MEASAAGLAGNGAAQGDGGQQGEGQGDGQGQPDLGALISQSVGEAMGPVLEQQREVMQAWQAQQGDGQQQAEAEPEAEQPLDLSQLGLDESYMDEGQAQQFRDGLNGLVQQAAERIVDQRLGPVNEQLSNFQMEREAERIVNELPDLGTPEVANEVVGLTHQYVDQNMAHLPPEMREAAKNSPAMWRLMYLANRGVQAANDEGGPDGPQAARLEGGGAASGAAPQVDLGDQIVKAGGGGRSALPFP